MASRNFLDSINVFLQQHVLVDAHNMDNVNPSKLDFIFSRDSHDMNLKLLPPLEKSHHAVLSFDLLLDSEMKKENNAKQFRYNFYKVNYAEIKGS